MNVPVLHRRADYIGIAGSVLCIIHCLITPVLVMTSALISHDALRIGFLSLDYVFIAVNIVAVWYASRHTSRRIKTFLWWFLGLFATGLLLEDVSDVFECVAYAASVGLVVTHLANIRHCRGNHRH